MRFFEIISEIFKNLVETVKSINKRYEKPNFVLSKPMKFILVLLRIYLIVIVSLVIIKFVSIL
jgi:hypothetical protein